VAFSIADGDFDRAVELLRSAGARIVRGPERLGQGRSVSVRDPDGTRLELHTANPADPLTAWS
jgi:catechol 2,3-dioxygenase-like lactoylglutathione lyase family enzyme